jgi:CRISPR system Cascade subunit CasD
MRAIVLRLEAPLMSFGAVSVDALGRTAPFPGRSMITGLFGSAIGVDYCDTAILNRIQDAIRVSAREDRRGTVIEDYQTVDLSKPHMRQGWTTGNRVEGRWGASFEATHIRVREMISGGALTVAVTLEDECLTLEAVAAALQRPAHPLFIGRKHAIPSAPIFVGICEGRSLSEILRAAPPLAPLHAGTRCWLPGVAEPPCEPIYDVRDWLNQIHTGRTWVRPCRYGDLNA